MGRPYLNELEQLREIYAWSLTQDVQPLKNALIECGNSPLLVVGSGGAATVSHLIADSHRLRFGVLSQAITPLFLLSQLTFCPRYNVWCVSSGGENPDILAAARAAIHAEPRSVICLTGQLRSPLAECALKSEFATSVDFDFPKPGDGFLATGSTIAFSVLILRAFAALDESKIHQFPSTIEKLTEQPYDVPALVSSAVDRIRGIEDIRHLIVLCGPNLWPVAVDIESKCSESALCSVQLTDYRNFAHGRHHWLAKKPDETSVIALISPSEFTLANSTLDLLPSSISVSRISVPDDTPQSLLRALIESFFLIAAFGVSRGIDPGRPGVPQFGRDIYNLKTIGKYRPRFTRKPTRKHIAIARKASASPLRLLPDIGEKELSDAYDSFCARLVKVRFGAVVLDYDGTLCRRQDRFYGLSDDISKQLRRLLSAGMMIGVATGRGKSVRKSLRECLPETLWKNVLIGYYNGSQCGSLADEDVPDGSTVPFDALSSVEHCLRSSSFASIFTEISVRKDQVSASTVADVTPREAWSLVAELLQESNLDRLKVLSSGHSVDILGFRSSKLNLVRSVEDRLRHLGTDILCIGDMGRWPGNDYELLKQEFSLSVDVVSWDLSTCWNISSAGSRGVQSCLEYLSMLEDVGNQSVQFVALGR